MLSDNSPAIWSCMAHAPVVHMNQYLTMFRCIFACFTIDSLRLDLSKAINDFKKITIVKTELSTNKVDNRTILVQLFVQYVYCENILFYSILFERWKHLNDVERVLFLTCIHSPDTWFSGVQATWDVSRDAGAVVI